MEALGISAGVLLLICVVLAILLAISPLMIWSKTSQMVKLQKEANLCLRILAKQADPNLRFPGESLPPKAGETRSSSSSTATRRKRSGEKLSAEEKAKLGL